MGSNGDYFITMETIKNHDKYLDPIEPSHHRLCPANYDEACECVDLFDEEKSREDELRMDAHRERTY